MEYPITKVEQEFFKRTFEIAKGYKIIRNETTFLLNCLYGIIMVSQASFYEKLNFKFSKNIEGIKYFEEDKEKDLTGIKIKKLLTVFRNSLAHFGDKREGEKNGIKNIELSSTENNEIGKISFNNKTEKIKIEFSSSDVLFLFIEELEKLFKDKEIIY